MSLHSKVLNAKYCSGLNDIPPPYLITLSISLSSIDPSSILSPSSLPTEIICLLSPSDYL